MKLTIEKAVYGGDGLGHEPSGRAVFVPYVLPGERIEAGPADDRGRAELVGVEAASTERVAARCRHFGSCGGCQYQHGTYASQVAMKRDILSETMERAGLRNRPVIEVHAGEAWGYRNRIRLRVQAEHGVIRFGYNLRESREFLPIVECPIAAPLLWRAAEAMLELGRTNAVCGQWLAATSEVEFFTDAKELTLQITMFLRKARSAGFAEFCEGLKRFVPELSGAGVVVGGERAGRRGTEGVRWGKDGLRYVTERKGYWVGRGGFFQVNRYLVDELVGVVTGGRKGLIAWDLFAGVGLFSRVLADGFGEVVAVEANALAIRGLASEKVGNVRGLAVSVVDFLRAAVLERERPELVVMDPPRAGAGREVCELLVRLQVPQIVYVSCDPTTLARDLRVMVDSGYNLAELHMVDLFPQTFHLETVAVLQR